MKRVKVKEMWRRFMWRRHWTSSGMLWWIIYLWVWKSSINEVVQFVIMMFVFLIVITKTWFSEGKYYSEAREGEKG